MSRVVGVVELTKEERIAVYKQALLTFQNDNDLLFGLCWHISKAYKRMKGVYDTAYYDGMEQNYPEIFKYMPKVTFNSDYWFPCNDKGMTKRMNILKKVIAKLESEL
jgi:hypothetical protein